MKSRFKSLRIPIILAVVLLTVLTAAAFALAADPMPGAIWTTDYLGHVVNGNVIYEAKPDVYLNGGPDKSGKLPDGMYYIQVTEPDGTLLGTTVGGKWGPQTFEVKNGGFVNGLIQLFQVTRFKTTTNPGGEYKVWVSTDPNFPSALSKTDNFKVKKQYWGTLIVRKFNDLNNSGTWDTTGEPLIPWNVTIKDITDPANPAPVVWEQTLYNGQFQGFVVPGTYEITEETRDGWKATTPVKQVVVVPPKGTGKVEFGNRQLAWLDAIKYNDLNNNSNFDTGTESLLSWQGQMTGTPYFGSPVDESITMPFGQWVEPGTYTLTEQEVAGWISTTPIKVTVTLAPGDSKKVEFGNRQLAWLDIIKFNDLNNNHTNDEAAPYNNIPWKGTLTGTPVFGSPVDESIDLPYGQWIEPGTYTVTEADKVGWVNTTDKALSVTLLPGDKKYLSFGNRQLAWLDIQKFYDFNRDKIRQDNEQFLEGWKVNLTGTNAFGEKVTKDIVLPDGTWGDWIDPGEYTVTEYLPSDPKWVNTTDLSFKVSLQPGDQAKVVFGNVYLGFGGGHTHGFWGNKNGQAQFETDAAKYLSALNSLYLVNESGTRVTPFSDYAGYAVWNGSDANAVNMAYMLSVQLAAMQLNVTAGPAEGFVNGNCYLYVGTAYEIKLGGSVVNLDGFITVNDLITAANNALTANQLTTEGSPDRGYQAFLKDALDRANNNLNFVQEIPPKGPYF